MKKFDVKGMSCAACSARVEKAVSSLEKVSECQVNLLTNSMTVEGDASSEEIISAVIKAGYDASIQGEKSQKNEKIEDKETGKIRNRLISSLVILAVLMYVSMGHTMLGAPIPSFFEGNHLAIGILQMLLSGLVLVINQRFFINGFKGLIAGHPNMDSLVALGSAASYMYSVVAVFKMTETNNAHLLHDLYFESAAMILALITVGKMLEAYSKGKTTNAIKSLMDLSPKVATVERNGEEISIPISELRVSDMFIVHPGESIPCDGVIISGHTSIDESALTGESIPSEKQEGSTVFAGTINLQGFIKCEAKKVGEDTTLSEIIKIVSEASSGKAPIAKIADRVSGVFVPIVILIAVITATVWLIFGESIGFSLARGVSVLVISCPCALGLATPVAIMVGSGVGARNGILFKSATALETAGKAKTVILDKTGTVTSGKPIVTDILPSSGISEEKLLELSASLEKLSEQPLGMAIVKKAEEKGIEPKAVEGFEALPGNGLSGSLDGKKAYGGKLDFVLGKANIDESFIKAAEELSDNGKTPLYFSFNDEFVGIIAVADAIKDDSKEAITALRKEGLNVVMLTGDNEKTANAIAKKAGIERVIAGVLPEEKASVVKNSKNEGRVIMVGDGVNDAPALTVADAGIAVGSGTDIAIESADIVLMQDSLKAVVSAITLSRKTLKNIKENLFWAFVYNCIGIPLAAGAFISLLGWELNPMFGAAAMSLSSFCVVANALRLNFLRLNNKKKTDKKEKLEMEKTLNIEGMMCGHCEARVKKLLEAQPQIDEAIVSHVSGTATIKLNSEISDAELKALIENDGYKVI